MSALALIGLASGLWLATRRPSNDRAWTQDQDRLAEASFDGDTVRVKNVRNFEYTSAHNARPRWEERAYDLAALSSVWYVVVPFTGTPGLAHTFVSFGFADTQFVAISVEIRKEIGEHYNPLKGLFRQYELMYVVADERDVLRLRTNFGTDSVFLYRIHTTTDRARQLFTSMLRRASALREQPEFYNTLIRNCTTTIVRHVNSIAPGRIPFSYKIVLPAYADELAYQIGLLGHDKSFASIRQHAYVSERARRASDDSDFSRRIRDAGG